MLNKRIIFGLLYSNNYFHLSRNFRLQKVGDINWLQDNYAFNETCQYIDELGTLAPSSTLTDIISKDLIKDRKHHIQMNSLMKLKVGLFQENILILSMMG